MKKIVALFFVLALVPIPAIGYTVDPADDEEIVFPGRVEKIPEPSQRMTKKEAKKECKEQGLKGREYRSCVKDLSKRKSRASLGETSID